MNFDVDLKTFEVEPKFYVDFPILAQRPSKKVSEDYLKYSEHKPGSYNTFRIVNN